MVGIEAEKDNIEYFEVKFTLFRLFILCLYVCIVCTFCMGLFMWGVHVWV